MSNSELQADPQAQIKMPCQTCRSPSETLIMEDCKERARALTEFFWEAKISAKWVSGRNEDSEEK